MRIAVIGAGIVGVTTAYELAADGHEVSVFERRSSVAEEASFANSGLVVPGQVVPARRASRAARRQSGGLFAQALGARWSSLPRPTLAAWLWRARRAAQQRDAAADRQALYRLALASRERLDELAQGLRLQFEQARGLLVLLREERELAPLRRELKQMAELGVPFHLVDRATCHAIEPGLNPETPLHAGIHLTQGGVGNCREFALRLKGEAQRLGAQFELQQEVRAIDGSGNALQLQLAATDAAGAAAAACSFDAVVVCAAMGALPLLRPLGVRLPMQPVAGYSITLPLRIIEGHPEFGPQAGLIDRRHQVVISRIGQRVRISGGSELGGSAHKLSESALTQLYCVLHDWFPGVAGGSRGQQWQGARPTLPDGMPLIGASARPGVWLNLGHGGNGWGLACGSARLIADAIAGRDAMLDSTPFALDRFSRR